MMVCDLMMTMMISMLMKTTDVDGISMWGRLELNEWMNDDYDHYTMTMIIWCCCIMNVCLLNNAFCFGLISVCDYPLNPIASVRSQWTIHWSMHFELWVTEWLIAWSPALSVKHEERSCVRTTGRSICSILQKNTVLWQSLILNEPLIWMNLTEWMNPNLNEWMILSLPRLDVFAVRRLVV